MDWRWYWGCWAPIDCPMPEERGGLGGRGASGVGILGGGVRLKPGSSSSKVVLADNAAMDAESDSRVSRVRSSSAVRARPSIVDAGRWMASPARLARAQ